MKVKTWLPVFQGFYGSGIEDDQELDWILLNDPDNSRLDEKHKQWILEEAFEYIDYSSYHAALAESICEGVCEELKSHDLISGYKFEKLVSPRFYNFSNDSIDVEVEVDIESLITQCEEKYEEFAEYLKERYTSCDGFMSSHSNDPADWFGTLDDYSDGHVMACKEHCVGSILSFLLSGVEVDTCLVYEAASEVYISEFIDYDKLIENFNDNFGTTCKGLDDVENGIGISADPEEIARRDIAGQRIMDI